MVAIKKIRSSLNLQRSLAYLCSLRNSIELSHISGSSTTRLSPTFTTLTLPHSTPIKMASQERINTVIRNRLQRTLTSLSSAGFSRAIAKRIVLDKVSVSGVVMDGEEDTVSYCFIPALLRALLRGVNFRWNSRFIKRTHLSLTETSPRSSYGPD